MNGLKWTVVLALQRLTHQVITAKMYENCKDGAKVGLCTINGGGHAEGDGKMGWDFVKQFSLS